MITYEAQTANSGDGDAIEGIKGVVVQPTALKTRRRIRL